MAGRPVSKVTQSGYTCYPAYDITNGYVLASNVSVNANTLSSNVTGNVKKSLTSEEAFSLRGLKSAIQSLQNQIDCLIETGVKITKETDSSGAPELYGDTHEFLTNTTHTIHDLARNLGVKLPPIL